MTIGSLFSGLGGLELGLEWAGVGHTVWQVEIDPYCRQVLAKHWPDATRHEDVRGAGEELEHVDVICGGFPCQDISDAGRREGIDGERSGLWREYARIIGVVRPRFVVIENVAALVVRGLGRVLSDLAALGFDAEWHRLGAVDVGAPHRRWRLFIIAWRRLSDAQRIGVRVESGRLDGQNREGRTLPGDNGAPQSVADAPGERCGQRADGELESPSENGAPGGSARRNGPRDVADPDRARLAQRQGVGHNPRAQLAPAVGSCLRDGDHEGEPGFAFNAEVAWVRSRPGRWLPEPDVGRVAPRSANRVDRIRALGNAVVPQCAEVVGWRLLEIDARLRAA